VNDDATTGSHTVLDLLSAQARTRGSALALLAPRQQGIGGHAIEACYGILAPAGTPPDIVAKIAGTLDRIRRTASFHRRLAELSYEPVADTPAQFGAVIRSDIARYAETIKRAAIERRESPGATP